MHHTSQGDDAMHDGRDGLKRSDPVPDETSRPSSDSDGLIEGMRRVRRPFVVPLYVDRAELRAIRADPCAQLQLYCAERWR